jgi:hypothetical protein
VSYEGRIPSLTSPVLRTGCSMALLRHGYEIQGSVEAAWQLRVIDVEGEFVSDKVEHLNIG